MHGQWKGKELVDGLRETSNVIFDLKVKDWIIWGRQWVGFHWDRSPV